MWSNFQILRPVSFELNVSIQCCACLRNMYYITVTTSPATTILSLSVSKLDLLSE